MSDVGFDDELPGYDPLPKAVWRGRHLRVHPLNLDNPKKVHMFLSQDKFWVNAQLEEVKIKDMDVDYLFSTMVHLIKRSPELALVVHLEMELRGNNHLGISVAEPFSYVRNTPLFLKLEDRYLKLMTNA